jgi:hypothetical protein
VHYSLIISMPFFFPYSENFIDLRMRIGSKAGVAGTAIVIESIGEFLVPKSIERKRRHLLNLSLWTLIQRPGFICI